MCCNACWGWCVEGTEVYTKERPSTTTPKQQQISGVGGHVTELHTLWLLTTLGDVNTSLFVLCRFVICIWQGMLPLRFNPIFVASVSVYLARFAAAADVKVTARDMRTGMCFTRVVEATRRGTTENATSVSLGGKWKAGARTYANDYLHPGYYSAVFSHVVRGPCSLSRHKGMYAM